MMLLVFRHDALKVNLDRLQDKILSLLYKLIWDFVCNVDNTLNTMRKIGKGFERKTTFGKRGLMWSRCSGDKTRDVTGCDQSTWT